MMMIMMITEIDVDSVVSVVSTWQLRRLIAVIIVIHQSPLSRVSARATYTVCAAANWKIPLLLGLLEEAHFINTPDKIMVQNPVVFFAFQRCESYRPGLRIVAEFIPVLV